MRYNLDPKGTVPDDKLWSALRSVQLHDIVRAFPNGLDELIGGACEYAPGYGEEARSTGKLDEKRV